MSHTLSTTGYRRHTVSAANGSVDTAPVAVSTTKDSNMILTEGMRGIRMMIIGDTAAGDTGTLELWVVERNIVQGPPHTGGQREILYLSRLGFTITYTISTLAGVDSSPLLVGAGELFADGYALTVNTYGQRILAFANGSADVYNNTGNLAGEIFLSDIANAYGIIPVHTVISAGIAGTIFRLDT